MSTNTPHRFCSVILPTKRLKAINSHEQERRKEKSKEGNQKERRARKEKRRKGT